MRRFWGINEDRLSRTVGKMYKRVCFGGPSRLMRIDEHRLELQEKNI